MDVGRRADGSERRVEARLLSGTAEVAHAWRFQRITQRRQGKFNLLLWSVPGDETLTLLT